MLETPTVVKKGNGYDVSYGNDTNIFVEFFEDAIFNKFTSDEMGKFVYDDYIMVKVTSPGNKNNFIEKIALLEQETKEWIYLGTAWEDRFPTQWAQFKAKLEQVPNGYPVTECPFFSKAYALNLKGSKVYTLEQIADMPDTALGILGFDGRQVRDKVKAFLTRGTDASEITKLFAKVEQLEADNKVMKEQLTLKGESPKVESPRKNKLNIGDSNG